MKYCFATAKIRTIFISSKFLEEKTQKDGILGEHGLIENAVLQVSFGFLHRDLYGVLASGVGDYRAINLGPIEDDGLDTFLCTIGVDGDGVFCLAELTLYGVVGGCLWQTGIDTDAVVVGLDAEDELRDGIPHPGSGTREPRVLTLARLIGILSGYHLTVHVGLHLVQRLVFLLHIRG